MHICHERLIGIWEDAMHMRPQPDIEVLAIALPDGTPDGVSAVCIVPHDKGTLTDQCIDAVGHADVAASGCEWIGMAVPAYWKRGPEGGDGYNHGDLKQMYIAGDSDVEDIVYTVIATRGVGMASVCIYVQPLLEPQHLALDDEGIARTAINLLSAINSGTV
jgi:hypothetical protein